MGFYFYSFRDWRIVNESQGFHRPILKPALELIEPELPVPELGANEIKRVLVFFEVPENVLLKESVFRNLDKKIIFK